MPEDVELLQTQLKAKREKLEAALTLMDAETARMEAKVEQAARRMLRHNRSIEDKFYKRYAKALSQWARLEYALSDWFIYACGSKGRSSEKMRSVFHSARSFNGSADMLKAAFYGVTRREDLSNFFRAAIGKTRGYYAFRNKLAHYLTTHRLDEQRFYLFEPGDPHGTKELISEPV